MQTVSRSSFVNCDLKKVLVKTIQWIYIRWGWRPFFSTNETTFQSCFKKTLYQVGSMIWHSNLSKYPIITFKNFFYSRKELCTQMLAIVFFVNFDTTVIYKKMVVTPYHEIAADTMTFLDILLVELSKFSSGISDFFFFYHIHDRPADWQDFKSENFFILPNRFSNHTDVSSVLSPFPHLWCFQALELLRFLFFTILHIDDQLIHVCLTTSLDVKCVCMRPLFLWANQLFYQIDATVFGCPEPCLLSIEPVSLNFFNRDLTEE